LDEEGCEDEQGEQKRYFSHAALFYFTKIKKLYHYMSGMGFLILHVHGALSN